MWSQAAPRFTSTHYNFRFISTELVWGHPYHNPCWTIPASKRQTVRWRITSSSNGWWLYQCDSPVDRAGTMLASTGMTMLNSCYTRHEGKFAREYRMSLPACGELISLLAPTIAH
jgi:hypothetical protein